MPATYAYILIEISWEAGYLRTEKIEDVYASAALARKRAKELKKSKKDCEYEVRSFVVKG